MKMAWDTPFCVHNRTCDDSSDTEEEQSAENLHCTEYFSFFRDPLAHVCNAPCILIKSVTNLRRLIAPYLRLTKF
ncbi:hypothetical protein PAECIP111890_02697 [Paenibacillus sp. JJ-223]|nr:hypothetical protein PAECIP111890_02697 [Paenibacillus sp. JJ-223]